MFFQCIFTYISIVKSSFNIIDRFCNLKRNNVLQNSFYHRLSDIQISAYSTSSTLKHNDVDWNNVTQEPAVHLKPTTLLSKQGVYSNITGEAIRYTDLLRLHRQEITELCLESKYFLLLYKTYKTGKTWTQILELWDHYIKLSNLERHL